MWEAITRYDADDDCKDVWILPANEDNFAYVVIDHESKEAAAVDGVCVQEIHDLLKENGATLKYILTTHHHADHSSGDVDLQKLYPQAMKCKTNGTLGSKFLFQAIPTPAHTMDHLCYYFESSNKNSRHFVFTGDFLFRCGCGYFFEGSPHEFEASIKTLFAKCDKKRTLMFFGHEYCSGNYKFAEFFEPENELIRQARVSTLALVPATRRTPSTLEEELKTNPFVRAVLEENTIPEHHRKAANPDVPLCGYIREAKNQFKN